MQNDQNVRTRTWLACADDHRKGKEKARLTGCKVLCVTARIPAHANQLRSDSSHKSRALFSLRNFKESLQDIVRKLILHHDHRRASLLSVRRRSRRWLLRPTWPGGGGTFVDRTRCEDLFDKVLFVLS